MDSLRLGRRLVAVAGGAAVIGMGLLTACSTGEKTEPSQTTTTTTSTTTAPAETSAAPPVEPGEKSMDPRGGNLFTPSNKATPAPTEPAGVHRNN